MKTKKQMEKKNGPTPYEVDYEKLDKMCEIQCTGEECAAILCVDYDTLNSALKRDGNGGFSDYFKQKSAGGKMSLRRRQYDLASEGNPTMLIWLGKQWLGQAEKPDVTDEGTTGKPLNITFNISDPVREVKVTKGES